MLSNRFRFYILISYITISGFAQGMLLPLLAILLENMGVSSSINGLHATSLYIGVLIASPFMEKPLQKLGYKPMILIGGGLVFTSLLLFSVWESLWFWFFLRLCVGIGDHMLSFATQTWITSTTPAFKRGRIIAIYGLFFSLGFSMGPVMIRLISIHPYLPFLLSGFLAFVMWLFVWLIHNDFVEDDPAIQTVQVNSTAGRFMLTFKLSWLALLGPFAYGLLEGVLHGSFPIYGLRIGYSINTLSYIIPLFSIATLFTQVPLGILSDRIGRKKTFSIVTSLGVLVFLIGGIFEYHFIVLILTFVFAGMLLGSLFSMGVSFMADILPKQLLPAGNILCGITFSVGSMMGPYMGGLYLQFFENMSLFYILSMMMLCIAFITTFHHPKQVKKLAD